VKASGDALVTVSAADGAASPTRAASAIVGGATCGLARRYTAPLTATVCEGSGVMPRLLVPLPSEASAIVAVPERVPALDVSMPTTRLVPLLACGASRVNAPLAVTPALALPID